MRTLIAVLLLASAAADVGSRPVPLTAAGFDALLEAETGRVVLVNLWATWCTPCLREIPELRRLEATLPADEFTLVAIAMDDAATGGGRIAEFVDRHFPGFETYVSMESDMDTLVSVVDPAWNEIMPTSYVLGRDGRVLARIQGGRDYEAFLAVIEPALSD
jgi:thiol-disulfide isomerase/thioredoxin